MLIHNNCRIHEGVAIGVTGRNGQATIISDNCFLAEEIFDEEKKVVEI